MDIAGSTVNFSLPTHWMHGMGYAKKVGKVLKSRNASRPLVLTDALLVKLGILDPVFQSLKDASISYVVCDKVTTEPSVRMFDQLVQELDLKQFDSVVAVGGGSVIDVAKGLAVFAKFGGSIRDYAGKDKMPSPPDWINVTIPTTAGTGSEVSDGGVFIDEEYNTKFIMMSKRVCATVALTDPTMTVTGPPKITAYSGVDALVHASESYMSRYADEASRLFSRRAIELIAKYLPVAYADGQNLEARNAMQIGSTMAMIAGSNVYCGLCHSMAMPLCGTYHMPHGQACGMSLPFVLRYNAGAAPQSVKGILTAMGFWDPGLKEDQAIDQGCIRVEKFLNSLGISTHLNDFGFKAADTPDIAQSTLESIQCPPNPRAPTHGEIVELVKSFA